MLDTNPRLRIEPDSLRAPPIREGLEKRALRLGYGRHACHSLREVLQLKLQQRRTREELVNQGIMPPLKSPAAFHEQRKSLERARTEDYLKRKIRSRPERSELVRMHILEETSAEPSLQAKQLLLKRARLADDLNDKISHRPGPMELIHKNILPVHSSLKQALIETDFPKVAGESSSFDEDSSDALSPDQLAGHDSPLGPAPLPSPPDMLTCSSNPSPTQFITRAPPPPPPAPPVPSPQNLTNGTVAPAFSRPAPTLIKSKSASDRPTQRSKKPKDSKPKVKKLKYHQYIPPDQKVEREPPPQLDSTYAKILHQQQLFLQLQIINQQQQHYNYHTILPAPPKPPADQQPSSGPSPSRTTPAPTSASPGQSGQSRQIHALAKPGPLPPNLDDLKVAELKQELKLRGLPVSGTKNDLIERLRNFQEQNGVATATGPAPGGGAAKNNPPQQQQLAQPAGPSPVLGGAAVLQPSGEGNMVLAAFPFVATVGGGGAQTAAPPPVMQFGSTSSSPPASPALSDRSLAGTSPDETSCNGDAFEMVSSPLTQLSLHPSPQPSVATVKEESPDAASASCRFSSQHAVRRAGCPREAGGAVDKDQMLQEKDAQIEALTRMLRQKQRLVETLRLQLERGKHPDRLRVKEEPRDAAGDPPAGPPACCLSPDLLDGDTIRVTVKQEEEEEEEEEMKCEDQPPDQAQLSRAAEAESQQEAESQLTLQQREAELQLSLQQREAESQLQRPQPAQLQQLQDLLLQQSQQMHSEHQLHKKKKSHRQREKQEAQLQRLEAQQLQRQEVQQQIQEVQKQRRQEVQQQQRQEVQQQQRQEAQLQKQEAQLKQKQNAQQLLHSQQVFINQQMQTPASVPTPSFPLDLLKGQTTPTLLTDSNGNHFLIALTNHSPDGGAGRRAERKASGHVKLQRLKSSPAKSSSQSPPHPSGTENQSEPRMQPGGLTDQPVRKGQRAGLHVSTSSSQGAVPSFSAPPSLQPFFLGDDSAPSGNPLSPSPPHSTEVCLSLDQHALFSPPSPSPKQTCTSTQPGKENGSSQHMDDLFDILIQSGEISASFKGEPDPALSRLRPNTPPPSPAHSSNQLSPAPATSQQPLGGEPQPPSSAEGDGSAVGSGRLEDFLESTTGKPLLGAEPGGPLTLIDDLHSQMLSTSSILDQPPSPMDTCDLSFTPHPTGLDFGDPALDTMDWFDMTMGGAGSGGAGLAPLSSHTPPSVFSADFLDSSDLQLHWDSCL
ncbi:myocardin-related transcription factor A isoform X3 [Anguilla anguilla]|uniref:myocardin-related transcription factor A isoform X3 n=1 Tax=Anguilla anguilla TaxID=7936 RepID=UPI0015A82736|nr:myocardin-related transcription factor A isoform X3 [Anguilla anguilla]